MELESSPRRRIRAGSRSKNSCKCNRVNFRLRVHDAQSDLSNEISDGNDVVKRIIYRQVTESFRFSLVDGHWLGTLCDGQGRLLPSLGL